ncbi:uncharacterized protein LOC113238493, partial [Hyposmocoma kahamanoa]|uniref:uncharacterized protein LOC113238493 n=1 Tax=Hyposmocoma kahamanoa TaxID=1477025 RepID=UPI000E6D729B
MIRPIQRPWTTLARSPNIARHVYRLVDPYHKELFSPAGRNDVTPQSSIAASWRPAAPAPVQEPWREQAKYAPEPVSYLPKAEPWRLPYSISKEQQAAILHHKQALTKGSNSYLVSKVLKLLFV